MRLTRSGIAKLEEVKGPYYKLLSRVFTPRRMLAVESLVREFCTRELDPLVGSGGFDFIANLGAMMPMRRRPSQSRSSARWMIAIPTPMPE